MYQFMSSLPFNKRIKTVQFFIIANFLIMACTLNEQIQKDELATIDNFYLQKDAIRNVSFNEFFTIEQTHILNHSELIPSIDKAITTSNYIFAINKYNGNKLFRVEKTTGKTTSIGEKGKGPGEYLDLVDFDVIESENQLILADNGAAYVKLLYYTLEGNFIEEQVIEGVTADYFAVLNDGNILFYTEGQCYEENCFDFIITNQKGAILTQYSNTPPILSEYWIANRNPLFRTNDGKIIATTFSDKAVYVFESADKVSIYELGEQEQFVTKDFLEKLDIEDDLIDKTTETFKFHSPENPILIDGNLIVSLEYRGNIITAICNLSNGDNQLINKFLGGIFNLNASFKIIGAEDNRLIILINSEHLLANNPIEEIEKNIKIPTDILGQPIIVFVTLNNSV